MRETAAIIERISQVNSQFQRLHLAIEDSLNELKPGQTVLARCSDKWDPYLREQWWPVAVVPGSMVVERPISIRYERGQAVSLLGPVGQPYRYRRTLRNVLLIAYDTPPIALLMSIHWLLDNKISVTLVLLGSAADYNTQHLPPEVEIIQGDADLNWPNRVMTVGWGDQVFVAVAQDDEHQRMGKVWQMFQSLRSEIPPAYLFGIFQSPQPCGVGACQVCLLSLKKDETKLICLDGPAVDLTTVALG